MAGEKAPVIIIKKKKGGGGHGHHGGAWKVAYADFVTAMMAFFLVMWLMGSDDETKAAISHYFNHPNVPYKKNEKPDPAAPTGLKQGLGESLLTGMEGFWPSDLIDRVTPTDLNTHDVLKETQNILNMLEDAVGDLLYGVEGNKDQVRFSILDDNSEKTQFALDTLGQLIRNFKGQVAIISHIDKATVEKSKSDNPWQLSLSRAIEVRKLLIQKYKLSEQKLVPVGNGTRTPFDHGKNTEDAAKNKRIEFILSYKESL